MEVTIPAWLVDTVLWFANLLTKEEWRAILFGVAYTFATTYILGIIYRSTINDRIKNKNHVRLMAIVAGFLAAYIVWTYMKINTMPWWQGGVLLGPLSIGIYHVLLKASMNWPINKYLPWLYPLIKGEKDKRDRTMRAQRDAGSRAR